MARSALPDRSKALLGIQPFWHKANLDPSHCWEKCENHFKPAPLVKESFFLDQFQQGAAETVNIPPESLYEETIIGSPAQLEIKR